MRLTDKDGADDETGDVDREHVVEQRTLTIDGGNEVGNGLRGGLIAVGGTCGDFAGVNMLSGSIFALGGLGIRCGAGMKRGSIVAMREPELLPTFEYACAYRPDFLRLYLSHLRERGLPVEPRHIAGVYKRWSGDAVEMNRGEVLVFDG